MCAANGFQRRPSAGDRDIERVPKLPPQQDGYDRPSYFAVFGFLPGVPGGFGM